MSRSTPDWPQSPTTEASGKLSREDGKKAGQLTRRTVHGPNPEDIDPKLFFYGARGMDPNWNDNQPIYRQLRDRVVAMILEGVLKDGDALPSVRNVAAEYRLNPLTVLKGYQELVDEQLVEKKRGRGMFVMDGARKALFKDERERFVDEEWPQIVATIHRLGFSAEDLLNNVDSAGLNDKREAPDAGAAAGEEE